MSANVMPIHRCLSQWSDQVLNVLKWSQNSPIFALNSKQIEIIKTPNDFYNQLKSLSLNSKQRITLSSLYIGTGLLDNQFISCIESVKQNEPNLELNILLDYNRCTRETTSGTDGQPSSPKSALIPLTKMGAKIGFYLTPNMSGWRKWLVWKRQKWNELASLHHIKCYIFDDNMIISGANLSDIYFTNRQDRYILLRNCPRVCDYFDQLIQTISTFSPQLQTDGEFALHRNWSYNPLNYWTRNQFKLEAKNRITELNQQFRNEMDLKEFNECNTIAFPLIQMKTLGISDDQYFTSKLLANCSTESDVRLASGYFNLTTEYKQIILSRKWIKPLRLLMASESANGFYGAKGVTANIPHVYTLLTNRFLNDINKNASNVSLDAFSRPEWSFHGKGLWLSLDSKHFLSMIGSPNFGYRSVYRDSEAQVVIITKDSDLKRRLEDECDYLWKHSSRIDNTGIDSSVIPFWVKIVSNFIKSYF